MRFSKQKFLSLPIEQRHRKMAQLLRKGYMNPSHQELLLHYNELCLWSDYPSLNQKDSKSIANRIHDHLHLGHTFLKEHRLLPNVLMRDRIEPRSAPLPIHVYLDHIRSAYNVGSIIRTAECFGFSTIHFSEQTPFADHKQVRDAAMGCEQWIQTKHSTLDELPRPLIVLETSDEAIPLDQYTFPETFTLILGNEETGVSNEALATADVFLSIPLYGRKNSLNVGHSFAAAAHEIRRQCS